MSDPAWLVSWLRLCESATPGPWTSDPHPAHSDKVHAPDSVVAYDVGQTGDSAFIAACSPDRVRWLLEQLKHYRALAETAQQVVFSNCQAHGIRGDGMEAWYSDPDAEEFMQGYGEKEFDWGKGPP